MGLDKAKAWKCVIFIGKDANWAKNIPRCIQIFCQHYEYYILLMFDNFMINTEYMSFVGNNVDYIYSANNV